MSGTIVMVHGAFCAGWVFDAFRRPFEAAGYRVLAPDLPGHAAKDGKVRGLSMRDYARAVVATCATEAEPPILLGHSLGGLVAQMAALKVPLRGLILLAPSAPWGTPTASLGETAQAFSLYALGPYWSLAIRPDYDSARRWLLDGLPREARRAVFRRLTEESGLALWETLNWWMDPLVTTYVPPKGVAAPTLAIAGDRDTIHPPATVRLVAARLGAEVLTMPDMGHWLAGEPGWETVADACLEWLGRLNARAAA